MFGVAVAATCNTPSYLGCVAAGPALYGLAAPATKCVNDVARTAPVKFPAPAVALLPVYLISSLLM